MKKLKLLALTCAGLSCLSFAGEVRLGIDYTDGCEAIHSNPARGGAGGGWVTFSTNGLPKWHGSGGFHSSMWELSRFSGGRKQGGKLPSPGRVGGKDIPLTPAMKDSVRRFLEETRAKGGTLIVRLGYTWSEQPGCEPADFDLLLSHVRELSAILADYDDVVVGVEAGIAGPWGEMHSSDYCQAKYMNRILETYCENLSPRTPVLVRSPHYVSKMASTNAAGVVALLPFKEKHLKRLGMYNDGYLGTFWDYGTWSGDFTRERGLKLLSIAGNDKPYGGELAYITPDWLKRNYKLFDPKDWNIVQEWYLTHLSFLRNLGEPGHTIATLLSKELRFDPDTYKFDGMPSLDEYRGTTLSKFVYDHMGYRFVIRDAVLPATPDDRALATLKAKGNTLRLTVENTGFGRLLLPHRAELLFTSADQTKAAPVELDLSLDGAKKRQVNLRFDAPVAPGEYNLALRIWCPVKGEKETRLRPIRLANKGMWNKKLKANDLGKVVVE